MGVEWVCVPSRATHLMFLPVLGSKESGRPFSAETMLRDQAWPHCGWSADAHGKLQLATSAHHTGRAGDNANFIVTADRESQSRQNRFHGLCLDSFEESVRVVPRSFFKNGSPCCCNFSSSRLVQ